MVKSREIENCESQEDRVTEGKTAWIIWTQSGFLPIWHQLSPVCVVRWLECSTDEAFCLRILLNTPRFLSMTVIRGEDMLVSLGNLHPSGIRKNLRRTRRLSFSYGTVRFVNDALCDIIVERRKVMLCFRSLSYSINSTLSSFFRFGDIKTLPHPSVYENFSNGESHRTKHEWAILRISLSSNDRKKERMMFNWQARTNSLTSFSNGTVIKEKLEKEAGMQIIMTDSLCFLLSKLSHGLRNSLFDYGGDRFRRTRTM